MAQAPSPQHDLKDYRHSKSRTLNRIEAVKRPCSNAVGTDTDSDLISDRYPAVTDAPATFPYPALSAAGARAGTPFRSRRPALTGKLLRFSSPGDLLPYPGFSALTRFSERFRAPSRTGPAGDARPMTAPQQGRVVSPLLLNVALHGLKKGPPESAIANSARTPPSRWRAPGTD